MAASSPLMERVAPACRSSLITPAWLRLSAHCSALAPKWSLMDTMEPASSNSLTTGWWPAHDATCSAVPPLWSRSLGETPAASAARTFNTSPAAAANMRSPNLATTSGVLVCSCSIWASAGWRLRRRRSSVICRICSSSAGKSCMMVRKSDLSRMSTLLGRTASTELMCRTPNSTATSPTTDPLAPITTFSCRFARSRASRILAAASITAGGGPALRCPAARCMMSALALPYRESGAPPLAPRGTLPSGRAVRLNSRIPASADEAPSPFSLGRGPRGGVEAAPSAPPATGTMAQRTRALDASTRLVTSSSSSASVMSGASHWSSMPSSRKYISRASSPCL
mmetsp:Transcript_16776/g.54618  ORF Transcript_16776/g.54618 Transcript_16776/m.54618 type:complete len:340 (-) Transcript_16776:1794-2813(-)